MADALDEAQKRFRAALDGQRDQRTQIEEDLVFTDPSDPEQWDADEKARREKDPGGARVCLVHDQLGQYIANVSGQVEQRPPALHAIPTDGGADRKVAEHLDGFFRQIEYASRAQQHYTRALTSAARAGVGYLIVRPEYTDRALNYQEPRIGSEGDPLRVVLDEWSVALDGSDAQVGFLLTPMSHALFEAEFGPKADKINFGDAEMNRVQDERESIIVAEQWEVVEGSANVIIATRGGGEEFSLDEDAFHQARALDPSVRYVRNYSQKTRKVMWRRMSGASIKKESVYPASYIGIVPMYGYVGWANGRMTYCGIGRRGRNPQRAFNFHISEMRALTNQAAKAPWWVPLSGIQDEAHKQILDRASIESRAYLPYVDWDAENSRPIAPPSRMQYAADLRNHMSGAEQALRDIQASLGMYQANLGAPSNETSGIAIENRKQQGEASTANFPSNMAASVAHAGRICMEMVPRLINTKRQLRVLSIDSTPSMITVDPGQQSPMAEGGETISINPNVGKYDVRVVVGASFSTQRQQAQQAYTEMMRANPQMMPAIAPLWAQTLDVPHADKLAQVLTAMAPEPVKAILSPEQQDSTPALKARIDQLTQALQEAIQHAQDAQAEADECRAELEQQKADDETKEQEVAVKAYDAKTKRLQVLGTTLTPQAVQALVIQTIERMLSQPEPLAGEMAEQPEMAMPAESMEQPMAQPAEPVEPMEPEPEQPQGMPAGPAPEEVSQPIPQE